MNKNYYAILMAGGVGSRFWPVSTSSFPKQFHDMFGTGETLIQRTFKRLNKIVPAENIYILTNEKYNDLVLEQLPRVTQKQVLLEPAMRNTAPCILYASLKIKKQNEDAVMVVAPSDHWIEDETTFVKNIQTSFDACSKQDMLMTLGITPTFPNTGYGYIQYERNPKNEIKKVDQFREKPDHETAQYFIGQGNFLWNAGIFMWSAKSIVNAFEIYQKELYHLFMQGYKVYNEKEEASFIKENYHKAENISIDYAILENAPNIFVLPAKFDWNDLGTWGSLYNELEKDPNANAIVNADVVLNYSSRNIIRTSKKKLVVIDSLEDFIVVDKDDVLLIYPKKKEQEIKGIVSKVKEKFGDHLA
ncbi:mannose-1-phosphate guanylyltransferase [Zhouia sp. PK063]|uniref:mannose-1-phosphate guanylyltransferase n=1 Tax=Zhouia sp. PK063 TaxID=3373602 RepID=UPI0037AB4E1C